MITKNIPPPFPFTGWKMYYLNKLKIITFSGVFCLGHLVAHFQFWYRRTLVTTHPHVKTFMTSRTIEREHDSHVSLDWLCPTSLNWFSSVCHARVVSGHKADVELGQQVNKSHLLSGDNTALDYLYTDKTEYFTTPSYSRS